MVELVIVIVLSSILGVFALNIFGQCIVAQRDMQVRKEHSDDAVLVLRQMSREIMEAKGTITTGITTLTLPLGPDVVYSVDGNNQLLRTSGGVSNVISGDVVSLSTSGTNPITVSLLFVGETASRDLKVFRRN